MLWDQKILPVFIFIFNKSPEEVSATSSPCFEIAKAEKDCDFIKEETARTSQSRDPSLMLKHKILLS